MASESETMRDLRSDVAKARDQFLGENAASIEASTLGTQNPNKYLLNRIEAAFIAGWNAAESRAPSAEAKDAERYRWLRGHLPPGTLMDFDLSDADSWDAAVDTAIAQQPAAPAQDGEAGRG